MIALYPTYGSDLKGCGQLHVLTAIGDAADAVEPSDREERVAVVCDDLHPCPENLSLHGAHVRLRVQGRV